MPFSSNSGKSTIKLLLKRLSETTFRGEPIRALDIGCGSGTYPPIVKSAVASPVHWSGIEIWEPYVEQYQLRELYDELYIEPALDVVDRLSKSLVDMQRPQDRLFDLIFIGDVLEHMSREVAIKVLDRCKRLLAPRGVMIVSVPIGEYPQDEYMGNPYEAHVDTWRTTEELQSALEHTPITDWRFGREAVKVVQVNEIGVGVYTSQNVMALLKPRIAAYMICKDEELFIERCLESLADVDEVVIGDTGSTDKTLELIQAYADNRDYHPIVKLKKLNVSPWRFDDARNAVLSYVSPDIDLCVSIDADEVLESENFIGAIREAWWNELWKGVEVTRFNHSFMTHWNWDKPEEAPNISRHFHERVHARFNYRWVHPVHEKLVSDSEVASWCVDALMKQMPDNGKSRSSYGPMLEQAVKEDPTDWKLWSFLANERSQAGEIDGALSALNEATKHGGDGVFIAWRRAALFEFKGDFGNARQELQKAVELNPNLRESHVMQAEFHERRNRPGAPVYWRNALECRTPTQGYLRREDVWSDEFVKLVESKVARKEAA